MENGLAVKTSSEDSGEASKNDTPSGGCSSDEMDVDVSDSNNISGAIPITEPTGGAHHTRRRCSSNTSVSTSVTSGIGTCSSVEEVPEMDFIKELDSEDEFVPAKTHLRSSTGSSDQDEQEPEVDLKRKSSDSEGNLEDFSFLRVGSNGHANGAKCSKTENGASSSSANQDTDNNKCAFFSGPAHPSWLSEAKNGSKMAAADGNGLIKEGSNDNEFVGNNKRKQVENGSNHNKKKHGSEDNDDSDDVDHHQHDEDDDDDDDDDSSENPFDSPMEPPYPPYPPTSSSFDMYQPLPICAPPLPPPRRDLRSGPRRARGEPGEDGPGGSRRQEARGETEDEPEDEPEEEEEDPEPTGPTFRTHMKDKVDLLPIPSALKNFLLFYRT